MTISTDQGHLQSIRVTGAFLFGREKVHVQKFFLPSPISGRLIDSNIARILLFIALFIRGCRNIISTQKKADGDKGTKSKMGDLDYVMTLDSDTEDVLPPPPATSAVASSSKSKSKAKPTPADADKELDLDGDFTFDLSNDPYADLISQAAQEDFMSMGGLMGKKSNKPVSFCLYFLREVLMRV